MEEKETLYYHAIAEFSEQDHYWCDMSKESIIKNVIIPFSNGNVRLAEYDNIKVLINFKSVERLLLLETPFKMRKSDLVEPDWEELEASPDYFKYCKTEEIFQAAIDYSKRNFTSLTKSKFVKNKEQVFTIMHLGDKMLDSAYIGVVKEVFSKHNLNVLRADEIQNSGIITDQILENIASSRFVLADLTGARPNCYYETGFAQAMGKELILTIKKGEQIHFDLAANRFIIWETENELRQLLNSRLMSLLQVGNEGTKKKGDEI